VTIGWSKSTVLSRTPFVYTAFTLGTFVAGVSAENSISKLPDAVEYDSVFVWYPQTYLLPLVVPLFFLVMVGQLTCAVDRFANKKLKNKNND